MRAALNLAVGVRGGVVPVIPAPWAGGSNRIFRWFLVVTLVLMVRIAAERTGRPIAAVCSELAEARGVVV